MPDTITLDAHVLHVTMAAQPVTVQAYKTYLQAADLPTPRPLAHPDSLATAVTYVSQVDALAYLRWLGVREGRSYRLPAMNELLELYAEDAVDGINPEMWPHTHDRRPELRGGLKAHYLCEWTAEVEAIVQPGAPDRTRVLGSVFYPPWLRESSNASHVQAALLASEGYSFITFRAARDL